MKSLLVTLADENYIDQAKQLFSSVYFNASWQGDYMLLAHEIPEEKLRWFREKGILIKECKPISSNKLNSEHPPTVLGKFYIFTPEFKKWDNVAFLDSDIIVRYSIEKLSKVKGFHAVIDFGNNLLGEQFYKNIPNDSLFKKLSKNFNLNKHAFNTGVMAFSTDIITDNLFSSLKKLFEEYSEICKYGEQPIINLYFYSKWIKMNFLYNFCIPYWTYWAKKYHVKHMNINAPILHFLASNKPWLKNSSYYCEWKNNLSKANLIDLKNKNNVILKRFNGGKIFWYIYTINKTIKIAFDLYYFIDKQIGIFGIYLKKNYPILYKKIKKLSKTPKVHFNLHQFF